MCYKYIISYYLFLFVTVNLAWDLCAAGFTNTFCSRLSFRISSVKCSSLCYSSVFTAEPVFSFLCSWNSSEQDGEKLWVKLVDLVSFRIHVEGHYVLWCLLRPLSVRRLSTLFCSQCRNSFGSILFDSTASKGYRGTLKKEGEWRRQVESNRWQHNRRLLLWAPAGLYSIDRTV